MTHTIRQATAADVPQVIGLYAQPAFDKGHVLNEAEAQAVFARFASYPNYRLFVVCDRAQVVGSYALLVMDNLGHHGTPSAVVEDVVVAANKQGQGIGRQMMAHAVAEAKAAGCYKLALSSNLRRTEAHKFYEALGFIQHGVSFVIHP